MPHDLLAGAFTGHRRLLALASAVEDQVTARPSLLSGWTVGHVLSHLAQDADTHIRLFESAATGRDPGAGSDSCVDLDVAAARPARLIRDDLARAIAALERAWDRTHVDVWRTGIAHHGRAPTSLTDLVFARWREVEVHLVDLGLIDRGGPGWADLPATYVDAEWAWSTARLSERLPPEVTVLLAPGDRPSRAFGDGPRMVTVRASTLETLRWLLGRLPTAATPTEWPPLAPSG
ncbi:maleylpyruvate isomerase [Pseudofrankia asymbiotica]|uniref:Maleylpyruvate isomerase n=1 Tax=Pseudofrankia asymbiotica TaxID=1834516 RepID=A0A1V2IBZ8_9ACTN|nr:maleylpyruvate isomerase [Pseudofrankia asymbiotica]